MKYTTNVKIIPSELDMMKIMKWDFHVDDSQSNHMYNMILGRDILSKIKVDWIFYKYTVRENIGMQKRMYQSNERR